MTKREKELEKRVVALEKFVESRQKMLGLIQRQHELERQADMARAEYWKLVAELALPQAQTWIQKIAATWIPPVLDTLSPTANQNGMTVTEMIVGVDDTRFGVRAGA